MIVVPVEAQGLFAVPAGGGQRRRLTRVADSDTDHFSPDFLPDGERLLFCGFGEHHGVFSIAVDAAENTAENTPPHPVTDGNCGGVAYVAPGYLLEDVFDPTGAGDCFAGGFIGHLAQRGAASGGNVGIEDLRHAVIYGSVMGSFCCEKFGVDRFRTLTLEQVEDRYREFKACTDF